VIARFEWTDARSIDEAIVQLSDKAIVKAGGIDLMDRLKEGLDAPSRLVNIRAISGLDYVKEESGWLRIGPMTTLAAIAEHRLIRQRYTALADAALKAATPQIRNMATVGGNLLQRPRCWYFAKVEVKGKNGAREIALDDVFVRPETDIAREHVLKATELLTEIRVPAPSDETRSAYTKVGQKESFDWPLAEVAVVLERRAGVVSRASIVLGAAAPAPRRATAAEKALAGKPLNEQIALEAAAAAMKGATPLSGNAYKIPIFEAVVRRTILAAGQEA